MDRAVDAEDLKAQQVVGSYPTPSTPIVKCKKMDCPNPVTHVGMTYCSRDCAPFGNLGYGESTSRPRPKGGPKLKRGDWLQEWRKRRKKEDD